MSRRGPHHCWPDSSIGYNPVVKEGLDELWDLVRAIPRGKVASYGEVGRNLSNPASGYLVGRWMAVAPEGIPWWRVVGKDGDLRTAKRDPHLASIQAERLGRERVLMVGSQVDMSRCEHRW